MFNKNNKSIINLNLLKNGYHDNLHTEYSKGKFGYHCVKSSNSLTASASVWTGSWGMTTLFMGKKPEQLMFLQIYLQGLLLLIAMQVWLHFLIKRAHMGFGFRRL